MIINHSIYNYTCSYTEAKANFEQLKASLKGFYTFERSASPTFEEPENTLKILQQDVLVGGKSLADAQKSLVFTCSRENE